MGFEIEMNGFDELEDSLDSVSGESTVTFGELFAESFMRRHTDFDDIEEFFEESPWTVEDEEDFEEIPEDEFDAYVDDTTMFATWESMLGKAGEKWMADQLGF